MRLYPDAYRLVRQEKARPLLDELERWLRATLETLSRKSDTAGAIMYARVRQFATKFPKIAARAVI